LEARRKQGYAKGRAEASKGHIGMVTLSIADLESTIRRVLAETPKVNTARSWAEVARPAKVLPLRDAREVVVKRLASRDIAIPITRARGRPRKETISD
jgi:hypothetical protein